MTKHVCIVGPDHSVRSMFERRGYETTTDQVSKIPACDFVVFTGGADIQPHLYGEENIRSYCNPARDEFEVGVYQKCVDRGIRMLGICRGMQLLNIMSGGKMVQDIRGHTGGRHDILEIGSGRILSVNSCHHQMCVPPEDLNSVEIIAVSTDSLAVPEAMFFHEINSLGIQGHPEWEEPTEDYFFELVERYF